MLQDRELILRGIEILLREDWRFGAKKGVRVR